jgi:hypothetical protein
MGALHEDQYTFMIVYCSFFLRVKSVSGEVVERIKLHINFNNLFFIKLCRFLDNVEKCGRAGHGTNDRWHMHIAWWITKTTSTHSAFIYNNYCFSMATLVAQIAPVLHYACIACLLFWGDFSVFMEMLEEFLQAKSVQ